ncbi:hypothetical protein Acr_15g0006620 [Actinidia rufa]|uniref:Uncharacterized protein n=1 Tax=Actinidia rufa TaxID=165716 RepID=A0A7J0FTP0_9ERIC|nr:hypothetical protein Acr_15g0006620 [Actinidia rufa]
MEEEDPFGSFIKQCLPTSSQEEILRTCPFARQSEVFSGDGDSPSLDSLGIPVSSTGIVMLSPPEDFQTPPEDSLPASSDEQRPPPPPPPEAAVTVDAIASQRKTNAADGGCTDSERAVDLGKDTDNLGFSEANSTQMISGGGDGFVVACEDFERELEKFVVLRRESSSLCNEITFESPSKKLKVSGENFVVSEPPRDLACDNELLIRETIHQENANTEFVDLEAEEIGEELGEDKVFVDLPMRETDVGVAVNKGYEVQKNVNGGSARKNGLLDALKWVAGEMGEGSEVDFDFLETAKSRGMTFPRPRWWPPEGYDD